MERDEIFISHSTKDCYVANMVKDFLVKTGIPNEKIFCSSIPGNDVKENIAKEIKNHLNKSLFNILIISRNYYESAYCLNEAGIIWFLDFVNSYVICLPEISHTCTRGFINNDFKLRRLNSDDDLSYLYDITRELFNTKDIKHSVLNQEINRLKKVYLEYLSNRHITSEPSLPIINEEFDDILIDGYHEVKNGDGDLLEKGEYIDGNLVKGVKYNIIIEVLKQEENLSTPVKLDELKDADIYYSEYGQYRGLFILLDSSEFIVEKGLEYFYVADKIVSLEGKLIKPKYTNIRTLENFLAEKEPKELDYIKTGTRWYEETDYADFDID